MKIVFTAYNTSDSGHTQNEFRKPVKAIKSTMKQIKAFYVLLMILVIRRVVGRLTSSKDNERDRVLLKYRTDKESTIRATLEMMGADIHHTFPKFRAFAVSITAEMHEMLENNLEDIEAIDDDPRRTPTGSDYKGLHPEEEGASPTDEETTPYGVTMVQAIEAWNEGFTGSGIKICIIDSGVDRDHEDLSDATSDANGYANGSWQDEPWYEDSCSHGTHVTGTIVATTNNSLGVVGVAPAVDLFFVKVFSGQSCRWTYSSDLLDAAERCANENSNIISMSLSGFSPSNIENEGFIDLDQRGILLVAAAGNDGCSNCEEYPSSYDSVVSVGAIDALENHADFSNCNDKLDFSAPGVGVNSTVNGGGYALYDGTSMATPHVSAVAALVWSSSPEATQQEVLNAMRNTAKDIGEANCFGYGLVQAKNAIDYLGAPKISCNQSNPCHPQDCKKVECIDDQCLITPIKNCCKEDVDCESEHYCDNGTCVTDCIAENETCQKSCNDCCCDLLECQFSSAGSFTCQAT